MKSTLGDQINQCISEYGKTTPFSGSVLIVKEGRVLFNNSYGYASIEHQVRNTPSTKYRIWSVTKLFTAMAVMILHEKGEIDMDDSIDMFFTNIPCQLDKRITIRHLLTHTSGIKSYTQSEEFDTKWNKIPLIQEEVLQLFWSVPLEFEPGTACAYNNSAYYLLGILIEKVTGLSYENYLKHTIFEPLGMQNTGLDNNHKIVPGMANGYHIDAEEVIKGEYVDIETAFSAAGLYSTVEDLFLWDQALYTEKLVSAKMLEQATTPFCDIFGLGFRIYNDQSRRRIGHGGAYRGFRSDYSRYPDGQVSIIILSNYHLPVDGLRDRIAEITFG